MSRTALLWNKNSTLILRRMSQNSFRSKSEGMSYLSILWHLIGDGIKPLREPQTIGRALKLEEQARLFHLAAQKPEWETAYLAAILAVNTTARKCELRAPQWRHVDFINHALEIPRSKTEAGVRVVPLNAESYEALWRLRRRAESFGQVEVSHFVFAAFRPKFRFHGKNRVGMEWSEFDPTQPVGSWRTAWRTLTRAIQCNDCGYLQKPGKTCRNMECNADIQKIKNPLAGLRFHDLRHTSISALGEAGVPDRVIMDIAGHVSPRMLRRYSHTQVESKRRFNHYPAVRKSPLRNRPMLQNTSQKRVSVRWYQCK